MTPIGEVLAGPSTVLELAWSGRRGSNSRPRAWEARALPTELHPLTLVQYRLRSIRVNEQVRDSASHVHGRCTFFAILCSLGLESRLEWLESRNMSRAMRIFALGSMTLTACGGFGVEEPEGVIAEVPDEPTYSDHVALIMERACDTCHIPGGIGGPGVNTSQYDDDGDDLGVFSLRDRIRIRSVEDNGSPMPPLSVPPLTDNERETLRLWIEQGAPR